MAGKNKTPHGSDKHGGGANINQSPPPFAKSSRYKQAIEIWEKDQGDGAAK